MSTDTETVVRAPAEICWQAAFASLAEGSLEDLGTLYDLAAAEIYGLALWRTGSPEDASDVVQETFLRVAQRPDRLGEVRHPRVWLLTVAHRVAIDVTRRRRRTEPLDESLFLEAPGGDLPRRADARRVSARVRELPAAQREAVYLHVFADLTFAEAGRVMRVPTFTAASRYRLAIARLRRMTETNR